MPTLLNLRYHEARRRCAKTLCRKFSSPWLLNLPSYDITSIASPFSLSFMYVSPPPPFFHISFQSFLYVYPYVIHLQFHSPSFPLIISLWPIPLSLSYIDLHPSFPLGFFPSLLYAHNIIFLVFPRFLFNTLLAFISSSSFPQYPISFHQSFSMLFLSSDLCIILPCDHKTRKTIYFINKNTGFEKAIWKINVSNKRYIYRP
jgi:hypothetical protein